MKNNNNTAIDFADFGAFKTVKLYENALIKAGLSAVEIMQMRRKYVRWQQDQEDAAAEAAILEKIERKRKAEEKASAPRRAKLSADEAENRKLIAAMTHHAMTAWLLKRERRAQGYEGQYTPKVLIDGKEVSKVSLLSLADKRHAILDRCAEIAQSLLIAEAAYNKIERELLAQFENGAGQHNFTVTPLRDALIAHAENTDTDTDTDTDTNTNETAF